MPQYNNYKNKNIPILYIFAVAPYTGAWIEIRREYHYTVRVSLSHPIRVRGLKCECILRKRWQVKSSHPILGRGLKLINSCYRPVNDCVALYIGALIWCIQYGCAKLYYYASYSKLTLFDFKENSISSFL